LSGNIVKFREKGIIEKIREMLDFVFARGILMN